MLTWITKSDKLFVCTYFLSNLIVLSVYYMAELVFRSVMAHADWLLRSPEKRRISLPAIHFFPAPLCFGVKISELI